MKTKGTGKLLRIFVGVQDHYHGNTLYEAIVQKAREMGLAGSTVIRGVEGFGAASRVIHRSSILRLAEHLPILIEIVDTEEHIREAISEFEAMIEESGKGAMMTLETVEILRYAAGINKK